MCIRAIYENPGCKCRWLQIQQSCLPNAGFNNCEQLGRGHVTYHPEEFKSRHFACPVHDLYGFYDRNHIRMIKKEKNSLKFGLGPGKEHPGVEVRCCIVM